MIEDILIFFGTNQIVLGLCSLCGIIGFFLTIVVTCKTANINKILKYNQVTDLYNKERLAFQRTFEGHRKSIVEDEIMSDKLLKDILKNVEEYRTKFASILTLKEKVTLTHFVNILKKPSEKVNYNSICNYLAMLSGRLSKKEDKKNV